MPITISTKDLLGSRVALQQLSEMQLPVRTGLKLRKLYRTIQKDLEATQDTLKALSEKHAKRDEKGNVIHPVIKQGENGEPDQRDEGALELADREAFEKEFKELMSVPIEVPFEKIKEEDLSDPKDPPLKIKLAVLVALDWLFV